MLWDEGVWTVFCNNSTCSQEPGNRFASSAFSSLLDPDSCSNHALVISIHSMILSVLLSVFLHKSCSRRISMESQAHQTGVSPIPIFSAVFNGFLGMAYLFMGSWIIYAGLDKGKAVLPIHKWLVMLFQGLTWLLLPLTFCKMDLRVRYRFPLKLCAVLMFLSSGFLCVASIWEAFLDQSVSVNTILDTVSVLGSVLLMFVSFRGRYDKDDDQEGTNGNYSYLSLPSQETDNTTLFAGAGFLSRMSFWWMNSLMKKGKREILEDKDIPQLREDDRAETCYSKYTEELSRKKREEPSDISTLLSTILACHKNAILVSGFFALIKVLTLSTGPLFLKAFINVVEGKAGFKYQGYVLTVGLFLAKFLESLSERQWFFRTRLLGLQVRSMLSAAIYQKQLRLSNAAKMTHSPGQIVNYVTVDAYRIGEFPYWFHQIWTTSLQICLASAIVYYSMGTATAVALVAVILSVLASSPIVRKQLKFQTTLANAQDKRIMAISEALANMKILKLYAWEIHFKNIIDKLRIEELKWVYEISMLRGYNVVLFWSSPIVVTTITFWACYILGVPLYASNVFTFLAILRILQDPIRLLPDIVGVFIEAKVSLSRIVRFLDAPELENRHVRQARISDGEIIDHSIFIKANEISWESAKATLRSISLVVKPGDKVAICGEVGSGKSTLLAAVLGEVPRINGVVNAHGKIAYVSQTAWIQTGTIQENILFGLTFDPIKYEEVLETCCLVKDLEMLPFGDQTGIGERGVNLSGGQKQRVQLARALYQNADIYLLDDPFSAVDAHTATSLFNDYVMGALLGKTVLLVTHQVDFLPSFNSILLMSGGEIIRDASYDDLLASSQEFRELVSTHSKTVGSKRSADHCSISKPLRKEILRADNDREQRTEQKSGDQLIKQEEREKGDTGLKPYKQYLSHNKGFMHFSIAVIVHMVFVVGQMVQGYMLALDLQNPSVSRSEMIKAYSLIGCVLAVILLFRSLSMVLLSHGGSESIFAKLLNSLFRAPMSFYDSTPLGRILSRVSSDLSIVDVEVAFKLTITVGNTINAYSGFLLLAFLTWPVLLVVIPMIYLSVLLQRYYYASAKELMRIAGTTKSTVASHLAESISGGMTIRAFGEENRFFRKHLNLVDTNAIPDFHNFSANEWLIQRLELLCAIVLSSSALAMTLLPFQSSSSGFIGMSLSYGLSLNVFLVSSVQLQCILANLIISVERLEQYMHIPSESPEIIETNRPPQNWPLVGKVDIFNLKVSYRANAPLVLKGISCVFEGGHKIGIVGRTGSGKSTLIATLFRIVEPTDGKIFIDEVNICNIGLHDLRSHLGIIPQDPTLFSGSIRYNLDPLSEHTDKEIWEVLEKCQLREAVEMKDEGLDSLVVQDGSNWSMGQRQLFCLGRALLKRSRILVLDEATASMDNATDLILQRTIRTEFAKCTVITVAHRIPTVMDCNMVLSISDGKLMEYDEPSKLINKEGSLFGQLVNEYWSHTNTGS